MASSGWPPAASRPDTAHWLEPVWPRSWDSAWRSSGTLAASGGVALGQPARGGQALGGRPGGPGGPPAAEVVAAGAARVASGTVEASVNGSERHRSWKNRAVPSKPAACPACW